MAKKKRAVPGINSSSTADIAFMLLIFFLITTSMDTDRGLARRLPPPPEQNQKDDNILKKERNVLQVRLNKDDQLMCGKEYIDIKQLREKAKEFIANPYDDENLPEKHKKNIPLLGDCMVTEQHVISVQNDVGTSYQAYINWLLHIMNFVTNLVKLSLARLTMNVAKTNRKRFVNIISRKFLKLNLKSMEVRSNGKI